jgi:hypothetical protein
LEGGLGERKNSLVTENYKSKILNVFVTTTNNKTTNDKNSVFLVVFSQNKETKKKRNLEK